jgi:hypothetical protein
VNGADEDPVPSRWAALPGDPPALQAWLAAQAGDAGPGDWPQEEPR